MVALTISDSTICDVSQSQRGCAFIRMNYNSVHVICNGFRFRVKVLSGYLVVGGALALDRVYHDCPELTVSKISQVKIVGDGLCAFENLFVLDC